LIKPPEFFPGTTGKFFQSKTDNPDLKFLFCSLKESYSILPLFEALIDVVRV